MFSKFTVKGKEYIRSFKMKLLSIANIFRMTKTKNIIVFESYPFYSDNTKVVFDSLKTKDWIHNYELFWIRYIETDDDRFNEVPFENISYIDIDLRNIWSKLFSYIRFNYMISKAKVFILSHRNFYNIRPKKNQKIIHLTHGISLKNTIGNYPSPDFLTDILVTSEFTRNLRQKSFGGGIEKMRIIGFPRNDFLTDPKDIENKLNDYHKTIVWLPTFRRQKNTDRNDTGTTSNSDLPIIQSEKDILNLNKILNELKVLLIIKPHPAQDLDYFQNIDNSHIKVVDNDFLKDENIHLYNLLAASDALITDYSSVFVDYLLTGKPIGFTVDDYDNYKNTKGFLVEDPIKFMPGAHIKNFENLEHFIRSVAFENDDYEQDRLEMQRLFHDYVDFDSTTRLIELLEKYLEV